MLFSGDEGDEPSVALVSSIFSDEDGVVQLIVYWRVAYVF